MLEDAKNGPEREAELAAEVEMLRRQVAELEGLRSEYEQARELIARERNQLRTLIDNLPDYIYIKDTDSRFVINNAAHLRLLGNATIEAIAGKTDFDVFVPELAQQYYADEQQILESGKALINRLETTVTPRGRNLWLLTTKVPIYDMDGNTAGLVGISRDITERKEAEDALERSNAELEQVAYMVSTEMQTCLQTIIEDLSQLRSELSERFADDGLQLIHDAARTAQHLRALGNDLLVYSREGSWGMLPEMIDSGEIVRHALDNIADDIAESGATVEYDSLPIVYADASQLLQLFHNLIANAVKYRGQEPLTIQVQAERWSSAWVFSVADNAIGIAPQHQERIFEIFHRLHGPETVSGTGIGLAICKKIVDRHGGQIWVESELGSGSTFFFTLPDENNVPE